MLLIKVNDHRVKSASRFDTNTRATRVSKALKSATYLTTTHKAETMPKVSFSQLAYAANSTATFLKRKCLRWEKICEKQIVSPLDTLRGEESKQRHHYQKGGGVQNRRSYSLEKTYDLQYPKNLPLFSGKKVHCLANWRDANKGTEGYCKVQQK